MEKKLAGGEDHGDRVLPRPGPFPTGLGFGRQPFLTMENFYTYWCTAGL